MTRHRMPRRIGPVTLALGSVALGCVVLLFSRSFLFSEASELLVMVLERGVRFRIDHALVGTRLAMWVPIAPMVALAGFTDDLRLLVLAFGAPHVAVPFLSLAAVVLLIGNRPPAVLFPALTGICLLGLPGQLFVVSGQLAVAQLSWVLLACIVAAPAGITARLGAAAMLLLVFFLHPVAAPYLCSAGLVLVWQSLRRARPAPSLTRWGLALLGAGLLRVLLIFITADAVRLEDDSHPSLMKLTASLSHPRVALIVAYFAAVAMAAAAVWRTGRLGLVSTLSLAAAAACLLAFFAGNAFGLQHGVHYLSWVVALAVPLQAAFLIRATSAAEPVPPPPLRGSEGLNLALPGVIFLLVTSVQAWQYTDQVEAVRRRVEAQPGPCVQREGLFTGLATSFDDPFGTFEYEFLATGDSRDVDRVVLDESRCRLLCQAPAEGVRGFFRLRRDSAPPETGSASCPIGPLLD